MITRPSAVTVEMFAKWRSQDTCLISSRENPRDIWKSLAVQSYFISLRCVVAILTILLLLPLRTGTTLGILWFRNGRRRVNSPRSNISISSFSCLELQINIDHTISPCAVMYHRSRISTIAGKGMRRIVTSVTRAVSSSDSNFWPAQHESYDPPTRKLERRKNGTLGERRSPLTNNQTAKEVNYLQFKVLIFAVIYIRAAVIPERYLLYTHIYVYLYT